VEVQKAEQSSDLEQRIPAEMGEMDKHKGIVGM
jgi:hypothetical protein